MADGHFLARSLRLCVLVRSLSFPHWTDFWIAIPLALLITAVRLWVMDPIATRIVVSRLGLTPSSLRQRNAKEPAGKRIPKWVLNEIDGFAQDMLIVSITQQQRKHNARPDCCSSTSNVSHRFVLLWVLSVAGLIRLPSSPLASPPAEEAHEEEAIDCR